MGILDVIRVGIKSAIDESKKGKSFKQGEKFEEQAREIYFPKTHYDLVERTHNYNTNKVDYVEASLRPDFTLRDRRTNKLFYLEVKYRNDLYNGKIEWCKPFQLKRYQECEKMYPVFVLIGLGGDIEEPACIILIPLKHAKYTGLFPSYVDKYCISLNQAVTSKNLWIYDNEK